MIEEYWQEIIEMAPTAFGKLVYVASLRDENKGTYQHYALEECATREEGDHFLTHMHRQLFYGWLNLSLEEQVADLTLYLHDLPAEPNVVLETWRKVEPFGFYVPAGAGRGDRELFLTDLRIIVDLLTPDEPSFLPEATT